MKRLLWAIAFFALIIALCAPNGMPQSSDLKSAFDLSDPPKTGPTVLNVNGARPDDQCSR